MVGAQDGGVPGEVVEAVHDDGDDDVEHDEGAEEDEGDEVGDGEVVAARLLDRDAGGGVVGDGRGVAGPALQARVHYLGPRLSSRRSGNKKKERECEMVAVSLIPVHNLFNINKDNYCVCTPFRCCPQINHR